ncbi:Abi family protein [Gordonibacter sp. Marseille-P4307]|uniref:Abi family protein n=1 Tax=Gordonibacter sp. Marseille-P4307 TaxID=2161815 RepID=UPI000F54C5D0
MSSASDDVFVKATRFSKIYSMFLFDREMRSIVFRYITKAGVIMKTSAVYAFTVRKRGDRRISE